MNQTLSGLLQLNPLQLPPTPSWWPLAWGWASLIGGVFAVILIIILMIRWRQKKLAPKKAALRILELSKHQMTPSDAIELVRQAALCYFPRDQIAKLTGHSWYDFLDQYAKNPLFIQNETLWQEALYHKESLSDSRHLIEDCQRWIQEALPPKKRR
jgi:hypothetical protein